MSTGQKVRYSVGRCAWTDLPGQAVPPVAVHLARTDGFDLQTLSPPQLLVVFDDVVPLPAGLRRPAQTDHVQIAKDVHAHLYREDINKVLRGVGPERVETRGGRSQQVLLHHHVPTTA